MPGSGREVTGMHPSGECAVLKRLHSCQVRCEGSVVWVQPGSHWNSWILHVWQLAGEPARILLTGHRGLLERTCRKLKPSRSGLSRQRRLALSIMSAQTWLDISIILSGEANCRVSLSSVFWKSKCKVCVKPSFNAL